MIYYLFTWFIITNGKWMLTAHVRVVIVIVDNVDGRHEQANEQTNERKKWNTQDKTYDSSTQNR